MTDQTYDAAEHETFGFVDDEQPNEEAFTEAVLDAEDYQGAGKPGMTPQEERQGTPLEEQLAAEIPDEGASRAGGPDEPAPNESDPLQPIPGEPADPRGPDPLQPIPDEPGQPDPMRPFPDDPNHPDPTRPLPDEPAPPGF